MQIERCKVCGGTINRLGSQYIRCEYCGQIYDLNGMSLPDAQVYEEAVRIQQEGTLDSIEQSRQLFEGILDFKDSASKAIASFTYGENVKIAEEEKRLQEERDRQIDLEKERQNKIKIHKLKILGAVVIAITVFVIITISIASINHYKIIQNNYENAINLYENGQILEAKKMFESLNTYKNSKNYIMQISSDLEKLEEKYNLATSYYKSKDYVKAISIFEEAKDYADSLEYVEKCAKMISSQVDELIGRGEYDEAKKMLAVIPQECSLYSSVPGKLDEIEVEELSLKYEQAKTIYEKGDLTVAQKIFMEIRGYQDADSYLSQIGSAIYDQAMQLYKDSCFEDSYNILEYIDEKEEWNDYAIAEEFKRMIVNTVVSNVNDSAIEILKNQGWDAFEDFLTSRIGILYTSTDRNKLLDEYINFKPVDLNISDYLITNSNLVSFVGSASDVLGNSFGQSIILTRCFVSPEDNSKYYYSIDGSTLQYNIEGKYTYLSGTIACSSTNDTAREREAENYLLIFADGRLVYSSPEVNYLTNPIDFRVDIRSAQVISFVNPVYHDGYTQSDILISNLKLSN